MLNSGEKTPCWLALEGVIQRMRPLTTVGPRAGCRKLAASHKFFCPCTFLPPLRARSCLQAHKLERVRCFWDCLYQMHGWTQGRALQERFRFSQRLLRAALAAGKRSCWGNPPSSSLERRAVFLRFSLPAVFGGPVWYFTQGYPRVFELNKEWGICEQISELLGK